MANYHQEGILTSRLPGEDLDRLVRLPSGPAVSVFMPTQRIGIRPKKEQIRLKNLLNQAEKQLSEQGYRSPEISRLLAPAWELQQNSLFWRYQGEGLAVYLTKDFFRCYRLPFRVKEMSLVGKRFYLKPILPLLCRRGRFYLLALSQKEVRLFRGSPYHLEEVDSVDLPQGIDEVLPEESSKALNFYSLGKGGQPVFHGHGGLNEDLKDKLFQYFKRVDRAVREFLKDEPAPLVLACVEYFHPIYAKASDYHYLSEEFVAGNPERIKPAKLKEAAWQAVAPYFDREREKDVEAYRQSIGTGRASRDVAEIAAAATQGRVAVLFVAAERECWGSFDASAQRAELHPDGPQPEDVDLLDWSAAQVFRQGQRLHVLESSEMPDDSPAAAVFHY